LSVSSGFYLSTTRDHQPESRVAAVAYLSGSGSAPFNATGTLLFFEALVVDQGRQASGQPFKASGADVVLGVDLRGDSKGRLSLTQLFGQSPSQTFGTVFSVNTDINLMTTLRVTGPIKAMPELRARLVVDWDWQYGQKLTAPKVDLVDLAVNVGSLVNDFLLPIADRLAGLVSPFKPFVDMMLTPIRGMEFTKIIGIENTPLGLLNGLLRFKGKPQIPADFFKAVQFIAGMPSLIRSWGNSGWIDLGSLKGFGSGSLSASQASTSIPLDLQVKFNEVGAKSTGGSSSAARSGFKMIEYIKDIDNWKSIFSGGDAVLFSYELPLLGVKFDQMVPLAKVPIGPVLLSLDAIAKFEAFADLAFGFDTYGIRKALSSGNPLDALDGFYVYDFTLPQFRNGKIVPGTGGQEKDEFYVSASVGLQLSVRLGPIAGGGRGMVNFYAGVDLQDIARQVLTKNDAGYVTNVNWVSDGRIRGSEIATMYNYQGGGFKNLFNVQLNANFTADVFVELSIKIPLIGTIRIPFYEATLFKINLFDYKYQAPRVQPVLAVKSGDTLTLNAGPRAGQRQYFDTTDGNETFILSGQGGTVNVEFDNWYQTYSGVRRVVVNMGGGNDVFDASRLSGVILDADGGAGNDTMIGGAGLSGSGGTLKGGSGNDKISLAQGVDAAYTMEGGEGDDVITGGLGNDILKGDAGNDKIDGGTGNDQIWGGTGNDQLRGGSGYDTYVFETNFGDDSFTDSDGNTALDFSRVANGVTVTVAKRSISMVDSLGQELRVSGATVDSITLTQWTDTVYVTDFPAWTINIADRGGDDDYRIAMGRASAPGATGTINITDSGGFDEIILEQTRARSGDAIELDLNRVGNGREVVTYNNSQIERLTLKGKAAASSAEGLVSLGGDIRYTAALDVSGEKVSYLGNTAFRGIGRTIYMESDMEAASIVLESVTHLNVVKDLVALNNGHIDLRTYGDGSNVVLRADLVSSSAQSATARVDRNDQGSGWIRIQAVDGSLVNDNGSYIRGEGAYVLVKAKNAVGTVAKPILTRVAEMTVATSSHGVGDVVIREDNDLTFVVEKQLISPENPGGYRIFTDTSHPSWPTRWESTINWDTATATGAADWRADVMRNANANAAIDSAVRVAQGNLQVDLIKTNSLLKLTTGVIATLKSGAHITLTADDIDFASGINNVRGTGTLKLRSTQSVWQYYLGTAAEDTDGRDYLETSDTQRGVQAMYLSARDLSAIRDGFARLEIGRSDIGNLMYVGDAKQTTAVKMNSSVTRSATSQRSQFLDEAYLTADEMYISGDVRSPDNLLTFNARKLAVLGSNIKAPTQLGDSGVTARQVVFNVGEQMAVGGWIVGTATGSAQTAMESVRINITGTQGSVMSDTHQMLSIMGASGGVFALRMDLDGVRYQTSNIQWDLDRTVLSARVQQALNQVLTGSGGTRAEVVTGSGVSLTGISGATVTVNDALGVRFGGSLAGRLNITPMTVVNTGLTVVNNLDTGVFDNRVFVFTGGASSPYGATSLSIESLGRIEVTGDYNTLNLDLRGSLEQRGRIILGGANNTLNVGTQGPVILHELASIQGAGNNAAINLTSADVLALNMGANIQAGTQYNAAQATTTITGSSGAITLRSSKEMLIAGLVTLSGDLSVQAGAQAYDTPYDGTNRMAVDYKPQYGVYNKSGYFGSLNATQLPYIASHTGGYGLLVNGNIISMGASKNLLSRSGEDLIVQGSIDARGAGSTLTVQSDEWVYVEAKLKSTQGISVLGGYSTASQSVSTAGADSRGTSVYIQTTSELITSEASSTITIRGKQDVDVFGLVLAGASYNSNGPVFTLNAGNGGSAIDIQADQQVRLESGLLASGNVRLAGGTPGSDDNWNGLSMISDAQVAVDLRAQLAAANPAANSAALDAWVAAALPSAYNRLSGLVNSAGGITAAGLGAAGAGSTVTVQAQGRAELMGTVTSGGRLFQTITNGKLVAQSVTWSGRESDILIQSTGRTFIGGTSRNQAGAAVTAAGYLNASRLVDVRGGTDVSGTGLLVYGASEIAAEGTWEYDNSGNRSRLSSGKTYVDGRISLYGVNDVRMDGLLVSGGRSEIVTRQGEYVGRNIVRYDVDSIIEVRADRQLIVGTDLTAGKRIDLIGGNDTRTLSSGFPYEGRGLVLLGSASITTTRVNSVINLSSPDRVDILPPADLNELVLPDWPASANGVLTNNISFITEINNLGYRIQAVITMTVSETSSVTTISQLQAALNTKFLNATWLVTQSQGGTLPALGQTYSGLATVPNFSSSQPDVAVKFREGRLRLVGPYELQLLASTVHGSTTHTTSAAAIGLVFPGGTTAYQSSRRYSVDAAASGSVINVGISGADNGLQYVAGKLRAYTAINLYSKEIDLDYTGVLETINGSVGFTAGDQGVIKGSVIAGGSGSDIVLGSSRSLTVLGTIQAADRVELRGGDGQRISSGSLTITDAATGATSTLQGFYSLIIQNTAKIVTTDAGGSVTLVGTNKVLIDGAVLTQQSTVPVVIESELGLLNLNRSSGRIDA
ncbi:MAG: hypothetical protein ACKODB_02225, partial [Betaproteobacteria bacterium]